MKKCTKCGALKPLNEFHNRVASPDGLNYKCMPCNTADAKQYADARRPEIRIKMKKYREVHGVRLRQEQNIKRKDPKIRKARNTKQLARYYANREKALKDQKEYRVNNPEKASERNRRYRIKNTAKCSLNSLMYKIAKRGNTPIWAKTKHGKKQMKYIHMARIAKSQNGRTHHVDHVIPLRNKQVSGLNCIDNLEIRRAANNRKKHNSFDQEAQSEFQLQFTLAKLAV